MISGKHIDTKAKSSLRKNAIKLSSLQIAQLMLDKVEELGIKADGIKSFDRKITEAIQLIDEETPAKPH